MTPMFPASQSHSTLVGLSPTLYRASLMGNRIQVMVRHSQDQVVKDCNCLSLPPSSDSLSLTLSPAITPRGKPSSLQRSMNSSEPLWAVSLVRALGKRSGGCSLTTAREPWSGPIIPESGSRRRVRQGVLLVLNSRVQGSLVNMCKQ